MTDYAELVGRRFPAGTYTLPEYVCWLWSDAAQLPPVYDAHPGLAHVIATYGMGVTVQEMALSDHMGSIELRMPVVDGVLVTGCATVSDKASDTYPAYQGVDVPMERNSDITRWMFF